MAKKKETNTFDWQTALKEAEILDTLKTGVEYYIERNKLSPKDDKELNKIIDDYKKLPVGA